MASSERFKHYTEQVCAQIRWKKAHNMVAQEIENHLNDQKNAYMDMGDSESTAEEKALLQMGDPVAVGTALDGTHKPAAQWGMLGLVLFLLCASTYLNSHIFPLLMKDWLQEALVVRLYFILPCAAITLLAFYHLDFSLLGKRPMLLPLLLLAGSFLLLLFGSDFGGQQYLSLGFFSFNSQELTILFPLGLSCVAYQMRQQGLRGYLKVCLFALCSAGLLGLFSLAHLMIFSCGAAFLLLVLSLKGLYGDRAKFVFAGLSVLALLALVLFILFSPYHLDRITYVLHPEMDPDGYGFIALFLRDLLRETQPFGPAAAFAEGTSLLRQSSSGFASEYFLVFVAYRFGWAVSLGLVLLLLFFLGWSFRKCLKQKSILGQMVSLGILSTFATECFFYILTNIGFPFLSSFPLPFLSHGMVSTLLHMAMAGILLSVFRTGEVYRDVEIPVSHGRRFIRWDNGDLIISFKN